MEKTKQGRKQEQFGLGGTEGGRSPTGVPPSPKPAVSGVEGTPPLAPSAAEHPTDGAPAGVTTTRPDPQVLERPVRRTFGRDYKLRILEEADACTQPGQLGSLLRREGLYSSHLKTWRQQRIQGMLDGLTPKRRGRKAKVHDPLAEENRRLRRENERLATRLKQAETIIEVQKKVSEILGIPLNRPDNDAPDD